MLCFACGRLGHHKENCPALIRSNVETTKCSSLQSPPRNQSSSVPLESDQTGDPLKECTTPSADMTSEHVGKAYGEWMVVLRRKKPNGKSNTHSNGFSVDETRGQDVPPQPRDPQAIP